MVEAYCEKHAAERAKKVGKPDYAIRFEVTQDAECEKAGCKDPACFLLYWVGATAGSSTPRP